MGKLDVGRTVFSRFNYCTGISSFENLAIMRICLCSNLSKNLQNQKSVEYDHVKIGRKIYIIKKPLNPARKNSSNRKTPFQNLSEMESNKPSLRMKQSDLPRKNITEEAVAPFEGKETSQRLRRPPSEADTLVSPAGIADSGFEEMSVLKHSLTHKGKSKPFLTEIQSLIIGKDSLSLQSYFPRTLEVMKATQLLADNYMLQDDASLPGFSDELNELRQHSNDFGVLLEEYLKTGDDTLSVMNPVVEAYWESVKPVLKNIRSPMYLQQEVVHPHLRYRGKIGCIAVYRSRPCVIDWVVASRKIKNDSKPSEFRRQLRLVAKLGAINFDPRWSHQIDTAILIISNSDGSPAEVITLNTRNAQHLWKMWLRRLQQYWKTYANERRNADEKLELHRPDCAANIEAIEKGSFCQAADKVAYRNSNISALYVKDPNDHSTRSKSAWERKDFNNSSQNVDTFPGKSVRESGPSIIQTTEQASVAHSNENKVFQGTNQCERNSCVSSEKIATETSNSNLKCDRQIHDESENTSKKLAQTPYSRMTLFSDFIRRFWKF